MARSESPLSPDYWLGSVDPRPLGLFRIGVGLAILHDLAGLAHQVTPFLSDEGLIPRGVPHGRTTWSVFDLVSTPTGASVVLALGALAVLAFTVGYRTRVATVLSWLFVASIHHRDHFIVDGGDLITRALLFWSIFADLGAAYSVDARRRATRVVDVPAFGLRLLQIQVAILYSGTARLKMRSGWFHDNAVYYAMQLHGFVRPPGAVLGRFPALCRIMTLGTLAVEAVFPAVVFSPYAIRGCRAAAVAIGVGLQLGILVTMRVGVFTEVMISCAALFLLPEWIDAAESKLRARGWLRADERPTSVVEPPRFAGAIQTAVAVQFVLAIWGSAFSRWVPLPRPLQAEVELVDIEAAYNMFGSIIDSSRWRADGVLADGSHVDIVPVVAPEAGDDSVGWSFHRWYKLVLNASDNRVPLNLVGAYFCRAWADLRPEQPLRGFTLIDDRTPAYPPGTEPTVKSSVLWKQTCPR